ncbi:MAG: YidH family protein [Planctomycetota bacterium]|jgi:hypothetical protein
MEDKQREKTTKPTTKSFMTVGPTLHYSHTNVQRCWLLALCAFTVTCLFWQKIITGSFWPFDFRSIDSVDFWGLGKYVVTGVSIFEYPTQIHVLGMLMGIIAIVPVLISQLMSFNYSLLFVLAIAFLANLPGLAVCILISCIAVACRPLRFRSRFIAIALCTAPQLIYWGFFGGAVGADPIKWGFSYTPWISAWLVALIIAGIVLGIGHFTRYRPGLVWIVSILVLVTAIIVFEFTIGFDELDYQLYVAKNNPEQVTEFHDHSIRTALDETINDPAVRNYLQSFSYPADTIPLRVVLKREIQNQLLLGCWPSWLKISDDLRYPEKKAWLKKEYDLFIQRRSSSKRMPIALYYKASLIDYSPDIKKIAQEEILHFYIDYPHDRSRQIWYDLYNKFGNSLESIEARWRIAMYLSGIEKFDQAQALLSEAEKMLEERLELLKEKQPEADSFFRSFRPPADSAITASRLIELRVRIKRLHRLIGPENKTDAPESTKNLAKFVMLNPYDGDYARNLDQILDRVNEKDPLWDNVLLAKTNLIEDEFLRDEKLENLHNKFQDTDGGMKALYDLTRLRIRRYQDQDNPEQKKKDLIEARATLQSFIRLYPESFLTEQIKKNLETLPAIE